MTKKPHSHEAAMATEMQQMRLSGLGSTQSSTGSFHGSGGALLCQPAADLFMGDGLALFGIAQALFDETGVVVLHVEILIDSFVENIAAITMLRARQLVDLLQF
jgi:hypothetical protein